MTLGMSWWQDYADARWEKDAGGLDAKTRVTVRRHLIEAEYCEVVDFGCGLAIDAESLEADGIAYTGVEQCKKFRSRLTERGVSVFGDLRDIESKSVDAVYCRHVLEHLPAIEQTLWEMVRVAEREIVIVAGETPGEFDRLSYDADRDLYWNVWGTSTYATILCDIADIRWVPQQSFQGRGACDESILYARLR
jgi:2-polyprenyl-3-methyl-5-hydroxy-6-metoxy-1,4-benzoquinol methylase